MTSDDHRAFTLAILANLEPEADVLGLVGLGSTSGLPPAPDAFSDHDLFVVTRPGAQDRFRDDLGWLPSSQGPVALAFRETPHGVKALLASGHLVEFAAFDPDELALAKVNRYALLLDRAELAPRLARVREATAASAAGAPPDLAWQTGQLLTNLVIGAGRAARGERLSGHQLVRVSALGHLVTLLRAGLPPAAARPLDDLDPFRRLELALPDAARALDEALRLPVTEAAQGLLAVLLRHRPELVSAAARGAVEQALSRAARGADRPAPPAA
jgi:hypothetical protein